MADHGQLRLLAVSAVVDVSSADGRRQRSSSSAGRTSGKKTLEYGPLAPAGSGQQPRVSIAKISRVSRGTPSERERIGAPGHASDWNAR